MSEKKYAYFDIRIGEKQPRRVYFQLDADIVPKTCENFLELCKRENDCYKNVNFHRIIPGFMMQGGDFQKQDGTGGFSIFGAKFKDENFKLRHDKYVLSMANCGPNTNGSQFFITFDSCDWLDGKHVVFGKVISGFDVIDEAEQHGSPNGKTSVIVKIFNAGECSESDIPK